MIKCKWFLFTFFTVLFSEEQFLWDLGVKIHNPDTHTSLTANKTKKHKDNSLFNEIVNLSSRLKISQKIIDQENKLLNNKIKTSNKKPTLIFNTINTNKENENLNAYQLGRYKDAIKYLDKINNSNTTKIEKNKINYLKANAYFNLGEYEKSEEFLEKIISKNQTQLLDDALLLKGIILKQQGKKEEALIIFSQIISEHPNSEFYESAQIQKRILSNKKNDK